MAETRGNVLKGKICHFHSAYCIRKTTVLNLAEHYNKINCSYLKIHNDHAYYSLKPNTLNDCILNDHIRIQT